MRPSGQRVHKIQVTPLQDAVLWAYVAQEERLRRPFRYYLAYATAMDNKFADAPAARSSGESLDALMAAIGRGDVAAPGRLFVLLYDEFKQKARRLLRQRPRQTLNTTELVHETWLRLEGRRLSVESRVHFFNVAAQAMRQVMIDRARARQTEKRGDGQVPLSLEVAEQQAGGDEPFDVLALDQVMTSLEQIDAELAELAQLYLFAGLGSAEIAEIRGVSERTVYRDWRAARMFLLRFLNVEVPGSETPARKGLPG